MTSEVQIPVSIPDGEANAGFLFKQGIFNKLKDDHLFWSVFSRPVRSRYEYVIQKLQGYLTFLVPQPTLPETFPRFTRTQRVCVSMATLYLAMLTNAMW